MSSRTRLPGVVVAVVLSLAASGFAHGAGQRAETVEPGYITGIDGVTYPSAPDVVAGVGDELFYGPDFDVACGLGSRFVVAMKRFAKVSKVIRKSGREVVWSMGLNKSTVLPRLLDPAVFPHGGCDATGFELQRKTVMEYADPSYLDLVEPLAASRKQVYFKTDTHWNTVGGAVWARALARRLDPALAPYQRYDHGTETRVGSLNHMRGIETPEVSPTARPAGPARVRTKPGTPAWAGYPELTYDHTWNTRPARTAYPGRTLLLGDSFMMFALENLRPLFRHGHWLWMYKTDQASMVKAIKRSDTVILESYQNFLLFSDLGKRPFLTALRKALR